MHILCEVGEGATHWEQVVGALEQKTSRRAPPPHRPANPHGEHGLRKLTEMTVGRSGGSTL